MSAEEPVPDWVDRRTVEWCADMCDRIATRLANSGRHYKADGATAAGNIMRSRLVAARPRLPMKQETDT